MRFHEEFGSLLCRTIFGRQGHAGVVRVGLGEAGEHGVHNVWMLGGDVVCIGGVGLQIGLVMGFVIIRGGGHRNSFQNWTTIINSTLR